MTKAAQNAVTLIEAGIYALKVAGWTEAQIIPHLPMMADEAVKFLAAKAAR